MNYAVGKLKLIIVLIILLFMISGCVFAGNGDFSYKFVYDNGNASLIEADITSDIDYSDLYVNVIKDSNGLLTVIYSGTC